MIDINTASADEIDAVPQLKGHGFEIVRYRDERGRFEALRQLEEVPGMAEALAAGNVGAGVGGTGVAGTVVAAAGRGAGADALPVVALPGSRGSRAVTVRLRDRLAGAGLRAAGAV